MLTNNFNLRCENMAIHYRHELGLQGFEPLLAEPLAKLLTINIYRPKDLLTGELLEKALSSKSWQAILAKDGQDHPLIIYNPSQSLIDCDESIMHELAHYILGHKFERLGAISSRFASRFYPKLKEEEADTLTSHLKFPIMASDYVKQMGWSINQICTHYRINKSQILYHRHDYGSRKAKKQQSISLLNGIKRKTLEDMHQKGFQSLSQLVNLNPDDLKQFHGIKTSAVRYHAQARAWVESQPVWHGEVPDECRKDAWFFDIETNPETNTVWSIGWSKSNGQTEAIIVAPRKEGIQQTLPDNTRVYYVQDANAAWSLFQDAVSIDDMPIFHWSGFDASNMKSFAPHIYEVLKLRLFDLCKIFKETVQIPKKGISLKVVAPYLGFQWRAYADWLQAWKDYLDWLKSEDDMRLIKLSQYQTDDVLAMIVINDWLIEQQSHSE